MELQELLSTGQRYVPTGYILRGLDNHYSSGCHIAVVDTEGDDDLHTIMLNAWDRNEETLARRLGQLFNQTPLAAPQPPSH
jgi:hypothetical protein